LNSLRIGTPERSSYRFELDISVPLLKGSDKVVTHIPYKGGAPEIADLVGGQIQLLISGPPGVLPHIRGGRLKAIATTAAQRSPGLPEVPTFAESGLPGFDTYEWYGVFAPNSSDEFGAFIQWEMEVWGKLAQRVGLRPD